MRGEQGIVGDGHRDGGFSGRAVQPLPSLQAALRQSGEVWGHGDYLKESDGDARWSLTVNRAFLCMGGLIAGLIAGGLTDSAVAASLVTAGVAVVLIRHFE